MAPDVKGTIGGDRPPRLGGDVVTLEDMREFVVAYLEYGLQMHVALEDGGDRVLARRRKPVDSATQMIVSEECYDGKPWIDLSEVELKKGLETFASVDVQQTSDVDFSGQISRVLRMDVSVPVDSRVFIQKRALRKYLSDSGLTDVVKPGGRQYTLKRGKVLVEAIAAGIEPLEFHRKVQREMRFNLAVHNPDALFNIIHQQRRDQAVNEANDHAHRQTAKRRDSRSVAAAETKLQGNAADKHNASQSVKTAGVKAERNRRYDNNECLLCGKQRHKQWDCPHSQQGKAGKCAHGQSNGDAPTQQRQQQQHSTCSPT